MKNMKNLGVKVNLFNGKSTFTSILQGEMIHEKNIYIRGGKNRVPGGFCSSRFLFNIESFNGVGSQSTDASYCGFCRSGYSIRFCRHI